MNLLEFTDAGDKEEFKRIAAKIKEEFSGRVLYDPIKDVLEVVGYDNRHWGIYGTFADFKEGEGEGRHP